MKKQLQFGKMVSLVLTGALLLSTVGFSQESTRVATTSPLELEKMLILAIQDEYNAKAEYEAIMKKFNVTRPFSNIIKAETQHIALLEPLFEKYDVAIPVNQSASKVVIPKTLESAYEISVQAEIDNIALYKAFLKTELPTDVRDVFEKLVKGSESHQKAFERGVSGGGRGR